MKKFFIMCLLLASSFAHANTVQFVPEEVVIGDGGGNPEGVWVRVKGQVGHQNCYFAALDTSLFYAKPNSAAANNRTLALLLAAQMAEKSVKIRYNSEGPSVDLWGFGISKCQIDRIAIIKE